MILFIYLFLYTYICCYCLYTFSDVDCLSAIVVAVLKLFIIFVVCRGKRRTTSKKKCQYFN